MVPATAFAENVSEEEVRVATPPAPAATTPVPVRFPICDAVATLSHIGADTKLNAAVVTPDAVVVPVRVPDAVGGV
jgi:hypothetical protein